MFLIGYCIANKYFFTIKLENEFTFYSKTIYR